MNCAHCKRALQKFAQRYQFTSTAHKTVIVAIHPACVPAFALAMAKAVRVIGRSAREPAEFPNILPV